MEKVNLNSVIGFEKEKEINKQYIQEFAQKYFKKDKYEIVNDDYYGNYKTELVAIVRWNRKNFLLSDDIYKGIVKNFNGTCVSFKDFDKNASKDFTEEFEGEIVGIYCATDESTKNWKSSFSPNESVQKTYKNKKLPISISDKKLEQFYKKNNIKMINVLNDIEEYMSIEQKSDSVLKDYMKFVKDKTHITPYAASVVNAYFIQEQNKINEKEGYRFIEKLFEIDAIDSKKDVKKYSRTKDVINDVYYGCVHLMKTDDSIKYFVEESGDKKRKASYILFDSELDNYNFLTGYELKENGIRFHVNEKSELFKDYKKIIKDKLETINLLIENEESISMD